MDKPIMDEIEKLVIERVLKATKGNKQKTADTLGIYRPYLYRRLKKYGLSESAPASA